MSLALKHTSHCELMFVCSLVLLMHEVLFVQKDEFRESTKDFNTKDKLYFSHITFKPDSGFCRGSQVIPLQNMKTNKGNTIGMAISLNIQNVP